MRVDDHRSRRNLLQGQRGEDAPDWEGRRQPRLIVHYEYTLVHFNNSTPPSPSQKDSVFTNGVEFVTQTLIESEQDVVKRWAFYGPSVPDQFGKLRLKIIFQQSKCAQNPDNNFASLNQMVMASSYNTSEENKGTPEKTSNEDSQVSAAPLSFVVQEDFFQNSTSMPQSNTSMLKSSSNMLETNTSISQNNASMLETNTSIPQGNTSIPQGNTSMPQSNTSMPQSNSSIPQGKTIMPQSNTSSNISQSNTSMYQSNSEDLGRSYDISVEMSRSTEVDEPSMHADEKIGSFGIPRIFVKFKGTKDSGDKDITFSFQDGSVSTCSSDRANGGCNDAYDAACIQSDDGLKLLDDSTEIKDCGMTLFQNYNCCGGPNSDVSFESSQSLTAEQVGDTWVEFVPNCNCRYLGPASCATSANRTESFGCGGMISKIDSKCNSPNGPNCDIRHSAKNDLTKHKSIKGKFPTTLLNLVISEPIKKPSWNQEKDSASVRQASNTMSYEEPTKLPSPAVLVTLGVNVDVVEESEKQSSGASKQTSKPINFRAETSDGEQPITLKPTTPQSSSEEETKLQNPAEKPRVTRNFKQNFTFSDVKVVADKESCRGPKKEMPKSISFISEEDGGLVSIAATSETETSGDNAANSFGMSEVAELNSQYHRNLEEKTSSVSDGWQKMNQVNAPALGKEPILEPSEGKSKDFDGQELSFKQKRNRQACLCMEGGNSCI